MPGPRRLRALTGLILGAAVVLGWAGAAGAHAVLVSSSPTVGAVLGTSPTTVRLSFDQPIDLGQAAFDFRDTLGTHQPTSIAHPAGQPKTVLLGVPTLASGEEAADWRAVTADGHTASGDVVFAVGAPPPAAHVIAARPAAPSSGLLGPLAVFGRLMWYTAFCLLAGALAVGLCLDRAQRRTTLDTVAVRTATAQWVRALRYGSGLLLSATVFRLLVTALQVDTSGNGVPLVHALGTVLSGRNGPGWVVLIATVLAIRPCVRRLPVTAGSASRVLAQDRRILGILLLSAALGEALLGHAVDRRLPSLAAASVTLHVAAVGCWLGTLGMLVGLLVSRTWRAIPPDRRGPTVAAVIRAYAPIGAASVATLALSGVVNAELISAGGLAAWGTRYEQVLVLKGILLVIAVPLGWWHWRAGRRGATRRLDRTLAVEAVTLGAAAVLAALLVGLSPASATPPSTARPTGVFACAVQDVQDVNCYDAALTTTLRTQGPHAALESLRSLADSIPYVQSQCHQVAHDLGRVALTLYGSAKAALEYADPLCDAGYIHGVLEEAIPALPADQLQGAITSWCTPTPGIPHSFSYFNCLHGIGHGIAIRFTNDLTTSLAACDAFTDQWAMNECDSGIFMQLIVGTWNQPVASLPAQGDLVWPCDVVRADQKRPCYLMATDRVLRFEAFDLARTSQVCDQVEAAFRSTCDQSLGRDISGMDLLDPAKILRDCAVGGPPMTDDCLDGAVRNAVYDQGDGLKAMELCQAAPDAYRSRCLAVRQDALSRL